MKVINEWDGAPAQTPTQIIREWYAEHHRDIESYGIAGPPVDALMSALALLFAAGPWRTDVENAPKDGSKVMLAWGSERIGIAVFYWDNDANVWVDGNGSYVEHEYVIAFATINQPETTK